MKKLLLIIMATVIPLCCFAENFWESETKCSIMSRDFVKERVNNPLTIQFKKGGVFEADGYKSCIVINKFTAKNNYGVEREYTYKIKMKYVGTNNDWAEKSNWQMVYLIIEDAENGKQWRF